MDAASIAIAALAGLVHGLTGFGGILVAVPLFTMVLGATMAVPLASLVAMAVNITLATDLRGQTQWRFILRTLVFALPGVALGLTALRKLPPWSIEALLGVVLLAFAGHQLAGRQPSRSPSRRWEVLVGFASGCLGGAIGTHGPPVTIYLASQPWPKDMFKATLTSYLLVSGIVIATGQVATGLINQELLITFAKVSPGLALGIIAGRYAYSHLGDRQYKAAVCTLLLVLGASLLLRAVS